MGVDTRPKQHGDEGFNLKLGGGSIGPGLGFRAKRIRPNPLVIRMQPIHQIPALGVG